jgi:hypothetical protein
MADNERWKNCLGFALREFKIISDEVFVKVPLDKKILKENFVATTEEEAEGIAIFGQVYGKRGVVHLATRVGKTDQYVHRPRFDAEPEIANVREIKPDKSHSTNYARINRGERTDLTPPEHRVFLKLKR